MVTKLICNYINTHHLQDPKDTECILCDGPMFDLFNVEEFKFNDLQKLVNAQLLA
jgi:chromatin remodeling complex protein RSC6